MNKVLSKLLIGIEFEEDIQKDSYNLLVHWSYVKKKDKLNMNFLT